MDTQMLKNLQNTTAELSEKVPHLKLFVLFGSRAIGHAHVNSDWDFAVSYDEDIRKVHEQGEWSKLKIFSVLEDVFELPKGKIDVVELNHCSPLMGYLVARDGKLLYEKEPNEFTKFRCKAWKIYADTAKFRKAQRRSIELALQSWGV